MIFFLLISFGLRLIHTHIHNAYTHMRELYAALDICAWI